MTSIENSTAINQQRLQEKDAAFEKWLADPTVKVLMSLVPQSDAHPEAVSTLMRNAFNAGESFGAVGVATMMIESLFKNRPAKD